MRITRCLLDRDAEGLVRQGFGMMLRAEPDELPCLRRPERIGSQRTTVDWSPTEAPSSPPSFITSGSAVAILETSSGRREWKLAENGYQQEWRALADILHEDRDADLSTLTAGNDVPFGHRHRLAGI